MKKGQKTKIAVMASGNGTNLQALIDHCKTGDIPAEIAFVVSNKKYANALELAKKENIRSAVFEPEKFSTRTLMCSKMAKTFKENNIDLVCLAGYMLRIEPCLVRSFSHRILNIHPALLPKFGGKGMYGRRVHEAVIRSGEKESGCTVHLVDEIYDHGAVVAQAKVKVDSNDTADSLAQKIHAKEHQLYPAVVKKVCEGTINLDKIAGGSK